MLAWKWIFVKHTLSSFLWLSELSVVLLRHLFSLLTNGSCLDLFKSTRGLRQGVFSIPVLVSPRSVRIEKGYLWGKKVEELTTYLQVKAYNSPIYILWMMFDIPSFLWWREETIPRYIIWTKFSTWLQEWLLIWTNLPYIFQRWMLIMATFKYSFPLRHP